MHAAAGRCCACTAMSVLHGLNVQFAYLSIVICPLHAAVADGPAA
jgi:hypothetical protein